MKIKEIKEGFEWLGIGLLIIAEIPIAAVKAAVGCIKDANKSKNKVQTVDVDVSKCEKKAQEWMKDCYEKKNGAV